LTLIATIPIAVRVGLRPINGKPLTNVGSAVQWEDRSSVNRGIGWPVFGDPITPSKGRADHDHRLSIYPYGWSIGAQFNVLVSDSDSHSMTQLRREFRQ
jgi:hypothetical protein